MQHKLPTEEHLWLPDHFVLRAAFINSIFLASPTPTGPCTKKLASSACHVSMASAPALSLDEKSPSNTGGPKGPKVRPRRFGPGPALGDPAKGSVVLRLGRAHVRGEVGALARQRADVEARQPPDPHRVPAAERRRV